MVKKKQLKQYEELKKVVNSGELMCSWMGSSSCYTKVIVCSMKSTTLYAQFEEHSSTYNPYTCLLLIHVSMLHIYITNVSTHVHRWINYRYSCAFCTLTLEWKAYDYHVRKWIVLGDPKNATHILMNKTFIILLSPWYFWLVKIQYL